MSDFNQAILQALAELKEDQREGFRQIAIRLDIQNGRIGKAEREITRLKTIYTLGAGGVGIALHALWEIIFR